MDDVASTPKAAVQDLEPARHLMGSALLRSEEFVPFALDCFAPAVSNAVADEAAAIARTHRGA
jgi:hypothetical protein